MAYNFQLQFMAKTSKNIWPLIVSPSSIPTYIKSTYLKIFFAGCIDWSEAATQTDITNSLTSSFAQTDQASVNANPLFETTSDLLNKLRRDQTLNIDSFTNVNELPAAVTTSSTVASTSMSKRIRKRKRLVDLN